QWLQRSLLRTSRRVGGDDDVASQQRHGRVLCGRLPCPPRQPQQLDTAARVLTHDRVGLVGRGVRHHEDLPAIRGIVETQQILERSEEHTSELQSPYDLVCRLLLEKKKRNKKNDRG